MEWISVEDQLPPAGTTVLLYQSWPKDTRFNLRADPLRRCFIHIGGLRIMGGDKKFVSYTDQYSDLGLKHISHWMPLPNPPEV